MTRVVFLAGPSAFASIRALPPDPFAPPTVSSLGFYPTRSPDFAKPALLNPRSTRKWVLTGHTTLLL